MASPLTTPFFDNRPFGPETIDTIVIHSMCSPGPQTYAYHIAHCHQALLAHQVSCHFYIDRNGTAIASVDPMYRAWHAGKSCMPFLDDNREAVNDFSIGIEILCRPDDDFLECQYENLIFLIQKLSSKYPISSIVGHDQIAPGRKSDPGTRFDWSRLKTACNNNLRFL